MLVETKFARRQAITLQRKRSKTSDNNNLAPLLGEKQQVVVIVSMVLNGAACWLCVVGAENGPMNGRRPCSDPSLLHIDGVFGNDATLTELFTFSSRIAFFVCTTHCHWRGECGSVMCQKQLESKRAANYSLMRNWLRRCFLYPTYIERFHLYLFKSM